ncbi:unnamed protein product [Amoebophrya sp. A120]|nr:unnamed protein product [Amoebophrya sp. A120]|eukprot:GSA120T00002673001.1
MRRPRSVTFIFSGNRELDVTLAHQRTHARRTLVSFLVHALVFARCCLGESAPWPMPRGMVHNPKNPYEPNTVQVFRPRNFIDLDELRIRGQETRGVVQQKLNRRGPTPAASNKKQKDAASASPPQPAAAFISYSETGKASIPKVTEDDEDVSLVRVKARYYHGKKNPFTDWLFGKDDAEKDADKSSPAKGDVDAEETPESKPVTKVVKKPEATGVNKKDAKSEKVHLPVKKKAPAAKTAANAAKTDADGKDINHKKPVVIAKTSGEKKVEANEKNRKKAAATHGQEDAKKDKASESSDDEQRAQDSTDEDAESTDEGMEKQEPPAKDVGDKDHGNKKHSLLLVGKAKSKQRQLTTKSLTLGAASSAGHSKTGVVEQSQTGTSSAAQKFASTATKGRKSGASTSSKVVKKTTTTSKKKSFLKTRLKKTSKAKTSASASKSKTKTKRKSKSKTKAAASSSSTKEQAKIRKETATVGAAAKKHQVKKETHLSHVQAKETAAKENLGKRRAAVGSHGAEATSEGNFDAKLWFTVKRAAKCCSSVILSTDHFYKTEAEAEYHGSRECGITYSRNQCMGFQIDGDAGKYMYTTYKSCCASDCRNHVELNQSVWIRDEGQNSDLCATEGKTGVKKSSAAGSV